MKPNSIAVPDQNGADTAGDAAFKHRDARSYDAVTDSFARFTSRFSLAPSSQLVNYARVEPHHAVLDIATGTGVVALEAARRLDSGRVTAIDLSEGMLETAQRLARGSTEGSRIDWKRMDAEQLAFPGPTFDRVVSLFALLHFPDPLAALREMYRVLRPGGRLVLGLGSRPPLLRPSGIRAAAAAARARALTALGRELEAPAFLDQLVAAHIPAGKGQEQSELARQTQHRSRPAAMLVAQAGFTRVQASWTGFDHRIGSAAEFWDLQRTFSSFARKRLTEAPPDAVETVHREFDRRVQDVLRRGGSLRYRVGVLFIAADRP